MKISGYLLLFYLSFASYSQITVSGKVVEKGSGEALPYATINIAGTSSGTTTNLEGFFTLFAVSSDTTTLRFSYIGYETITIKLSPDKLKTPVSVALEVLSTNLEEVVVSADSYKVLQTNAGVSVASISTKQLSQLPSIGEVDIFRSLQLLPGISSTNQSSAGLFVRGGTPEQNLVLLDGITVYKVDHFFGFFSAFNAIAVKDAKIYKGAFPAKYGGRISSVVDMNLKTGSFEKFRGAAGANLFAFNAMMEGPIGEKMAFMIAGRRSFGGVINSDSFKKLGDNLLGDNEFSGVQEGDNVRVNELKPDFNFFDLNAKLSFRPTEKDLITVSYYGGKDFLNESRDLLATIPISGNEVDNRELAIDIQSTTNWGNSGGALRWSRQWSPKLFTNFIGSSSKYFSEYDRDASLMLTIPSMDSVITGGALKTLEDNVVRDETYRFDLEWNPNADHAVEAGVNLVRTGIDYLNLRDDSIKVLERREHANYLAVYLSDTWQVNSRFTMVPGLRLAHYNFTNATFLTPRLSMTYQLAERVKVKGAYGKFYQYVSRIINENLSEGARDFWLLADGEQVPVGSAHHFIGGISYETNGWLFDVESYYKDLSGLSEFTLRFRTAGTLDPEELFFSGEGVAKGTELLVQKKSGQYTGWIAYTLGTIRHTFDGLNDGRVFPALHDQLHEFKVVQSVDVNEWTLASTFIYGSGKAFSEPSGQYGVELLDGRILNYVGVGDKNGSRLKPFHRLDISAHYKWIRGKARMDLGLSLFNVYNRENTSYFQYDFQQDPTVITEVKYIGFTPNMSFNVEF